MSLHRSLKTKPIALAQHRNVLTRAERIGKLTESEKFTTGRTPLGLPKVANRMAVAAKKPKKEAVEGEAGAEGAAPGAAATAGKGAAPAAKGAAPAAKGAAPAAKSAGKK